MRRWVFSILALVLVALVAWPLFLIQYGNSKMAHLEALSGRADTPGTTYFIVGSDKRQEEGINDGTEGERADTIMLLQVPESGSPALVSLPRDSYVEIPDYGPSKINAAYSLGGPPLLVRTVENLSGMTVDHYVEVSMFGVQDLVDAVGGVNLCLDYDVQDAFSGLNWQAGCHDVDGNTALAFSRMRYSDPQGDIGRTLRQRQVVGKVIEKAASPTTLVNPVRQYSLVGKVASNLTTDNDTSMISLARAALGMRKVMAPGGLMGTPPISSLNYRTESGESAVLLDQDRVDDFFARMMNGQLSSDDFDLPG
ncbi:LCP family protein [Actinomycetaceae bacterium L2_0104]